MKSRVLLVAALLILSSGWVMTIKSESFDADAKKRRGLEVLNAEISKQSAILEKLKAFQKMTPQEQMQEIKRTEGIVEALKMRYKLDSAK